MDVLYRCVGCNQVLCDADFRVSPSCPVCRSMQFRRAAMVSDDEMKAAIQRGFRYDEACFDYVDDSLLRRGIFPVFPEEGARQ